MSSHEHHQGDSDRFNLMIFLSFVAVFSFLMIMSNVHGPFKPGTAKHETAPTEKQADEGYY